MSTSEEANTSIRRYRQRFSLEPMFNDQKSNRLDLERTKVTDPKRLETLLIVIAFAHMLCTSEGSRRECAGDAKKTCSWPSHSPNRCILRWRERLYTLYPKIHVHGLSTLFTRRLCCSSPTAHMVKKVLGNEVTCL
jgi:hypothetical protein